MRRPIPQPLGDRASSTVQRALDLDSDVQVIKVDQQLSIIRLPLICSDALRYSALLYSTPLTATQLFLRFWSLP